MATPYSRSNSSGALNSGPSRTLLQQLLEEINGASSPRKVRNESPLQSPASTRSWSSSQNHSPSVWVGGSSAQDACDKLRAADEARQRMVAANSIDGAPNMQTPTLRLDTSGLEMQDTTLDEHERRPVSGLHRTPDPVRYPHDYMQHMMKGSPLSMTVGLSPATQGHDDTPFHLQASPFGNAVPQPLSPLIFTDVYFDSSSSLSPQTETTASPTEAPTSAATVYTAEEPRTPSIDGTRKRTHFFDDSTPEVSPQKRRTVTLPDIRSDAYSKMAIDAPHCFIGIGGDNRCVLRDETFTERAPTPRVPINLSTNDALPELSSFRPTVADPQGQPQLNIPPQRPARSFTSPVEPASPAVPDTPAWMRPMHLIDTGGKSIYMNAHDDGPIRHALCLYCFRTHGDFRKVHRHGYESCGRTEVLDSHYWESDTWPEDSSDDSTASDR
ncbi:hypothetical protein BU25DRAFT_493528 [Macroventuria anomochaeta]|uniref:Uncharacterized protein n=1 Tax=Macroventuria anomochaeta TaxID=301207 RepID=A0ACB6RRL3_9PLEO|nr:uncharacterized protein BU25DRAFT_493528 [Macroventuria anomochaeta]KAF2624541.1 hypothetical protein BU25DRAFT_493528 [Macroventuria anomochaeta]